MGLFKSVFVIMVLIVFVVSYSLFITFAEHREYSNLSLDYFVLTPEGLAKLSHKCNDSPNFIYSSPDGPKPGIVILNCNIPRKILEEQLRSDGFDYVEGQYENYEGEIQIITDSEYNVVTSVVFFSRG
jgi:hypothetical protein